MKWCRVPGIFCSARSRQRSPGWCWSGWRSNAPHHSIPSHGSNTGSCLNAMVPHDQPLQVFSHLTPGIAGVLTSAERPPTGLADYGSGSTAPVRWVRMPPFGGAAEPCGRQLPADRRMSSFKVQRSTASAAPRRPVSATADIRPPHNDLRAAQGREPPGERGRSATGDTARQRQRLDAGQAA